ncbi:RagB/SusD family nutrient uptake outer membrane protein [Bacteroides congonensis]
MKRLTYYISALALCALSFTSCSDLLDEDPQSDIRKNLYMNNAVEANNVLLGVYRSMVSDNIYGMNLSCIFDLTNDLAQCEGNSTNSFREYPANAFNPSNSYVQNTWATLYSAIYGANDFIERLEAKIVTYSQKDQAVATIYLAEARALRALYYFELVRWYGNIALITSTTESYKNPAEFVQSSPEEVYKFIEEDLKFAVNNLPYATDDVLRSDTRFRFSKGAALGLLTRVYVTWAGHPILDTSKWKEAAQTAALLVNSGKHHLLDDYEQLWKNTCNGKWDPAESLIEVSFYANTVSGTASEDPVGRIGKWNGVRATEIAGIRGRNSANVKVVHTFYLDWLQNEANDKRRDLSIANYKYDPEKSYWAKENELGNAGAGQKNKQNYTPAKWDTEKYVEEYNSLLNNDKSNINWYVLRYSDVLLMYAEALNEWHQGPDNAALAAINMVRRRGYGLPYNTANSNVDLKSMSYEDFKKCIYNERAYELAFEGQRRQDLVRWGIYYDTIVETYRKLISWYPEANYIAYTYTEKNKHELLPIPARDMALMEKFKQNKGWGD